MSNFVCKRCGGTIIRCYDEVVCLNCGYLPEQDAELLYKWVKKRGRYMPRKVVKKVKLAGSVLSSKSPPVKPAPGSHLPGVGNNKKAVVL